MRTPLAVVIFLGLTQAASAAGYWKLDHVEFTIDAGANQWIGQGGETQITLLNHDNRQMAFRQVWRGTTETFALDWYIPDALVPGETAPFTLTQTCAEATIAPGFPFAHPSMTNGSLVADFNLGVYLQLAGGDCIVGRKETAGPPLSWKIPSGKKGDTTRVQVSAGPTSVHPVTYHFIFAWLEGATPPAHHDTGPTGGDTTTAGTTPGEHHTHTTGSPTGTQGEASNWRVPAGNTGTEPLGAPPEPVVYRNGADGGVTAGTTAPTRFQLNLPMLLTQIMTYHYGFRGRPGTIALQNDDGTVYGPWQAAGAGSAALPNVYWWVRPNIVIKAGNYTVIDSDPASWSQEAATHGAGIVQLWGRQQ